MNIDLWGMIFSLLEKLGKKNEQSLIYTHKLSALIFLFFVFLFCPSPAFSPVLLPSRVVQALNLNVHDIGKQIKSKPGYILVFYYYICLYICYFI